MEPYLFKTTAKKEKKVELPKFQIPKEEKSEDEIGLIQGQIPGSRIEWYVALALNKLGLQYIYQYSIGGGRLFRGGQVIDFFVFTVPLPTPLFVQGDYWHRGTRAAATILNLERAKNLLKGQAADPVEIWEHEALDEGMAYQTVKRKLL